MITPESEKTLRELLAYSESDADEGIRSLAAKVSAIIGDEITDSARNFAWVSRITRPTVFLDLETTSKDPATARIIEIGAIRVNPDGTEKVVEKLVNPEMPLDPAIVELTGITDDQLATAPKFRQIAKALFAMIEGCDIAGFKCRDFDVPILWEELFRAGISWDTRELKIIDACDIYHAYERRTLGDAALFYTGKDQTGAHRALADVRTTMDVLGGQLIRYPDLPKTLLGIAEATAKDRRVDLAGKIVYNEDGIPVWNFTDSKGKPVKDNPRLAEWCLGKPFPEHTKYVIRWIMGWQNT